MSPLSPVSHWGKIFRGRRSQGSGFYHLQLNFHLHAHQKQLTHIKGLQRDGGQGLPERSKGTETNAREREQKKKEAGQGVCSSFFEGQWKCFRGTRWEKTSSVRGRAGSDKERFHCQRGWHSTNLSLLAVSQAWTWHLHRQVLHGLPATATSQLSLPLVSVQSKRSDNIYCGGFYVKDSDLDRNYTISLNPPHPISSPRETLLFYFLLPPSNEKQNFPQCWRAWSGFPFLCPLTLLLPALEAPAHISSSKAKQSALTLRIFPEYLGRCWEFWQ